MAKMAAAAVKDKKEQGKPGHLAAMTPTASPRSAATSTAKTTDPVKVLTNTENPQEFLWAHVALIVIALLVALPNPLARFWGGAIHGSPHAALLCAGGWAILTAFLWRKMRTTQHTSQANPWAAALLMIDVLGLTALLSTSGAAQNPFSMLYFVPITLATLVSHRFTWRIAALSICAFGVLLVQTAAALKPHANHPHHAHFYDHVQGMAIALAVAGLFITVFVGLIARSLSAQRNRIFELSERQKRDRFVVALGALSAGAAHELGSPLATIQVLADDFVSMTPTEQSEATSTIVGELKRIKNIVHSMQSSQLSADLFGDGQPWSLRSLLEEFQELPLTQIRLDSSEQDSAAGKTTQPRKVIEQILRELHRNAKQASSDGLVTISLRCYDQEFELQVEDQGAGLSAEEIQHVMEPFVSHTGGTGLGLFLASIHAEQLGGSLSLKSPMHEPTQASLLLPRTPPHYFEAHSPHLSHGHE